MNDRLLDVGEIERRLSQELGELGETGGGLGSLGVAKGGGGAGARFISRLLRTTGASAEWSLAEYAGDLNSLIVEAVPEGEPVIRNLPSGGIIEGRVGIVGSGALDLNPTLLCAWIGPEKETLHVGAYAKEGLWPQRSARKAILVVRNRMEKLFPEGPLV